MDRHAHHHDKQQLTFRSVQRDHPNNGAQFGCITMLKQCWERHGQLRLQLLMHQSLICSNPTLTMSAHALDKTKMLNFSLTEHLQHTCACLDDQCV